MKRNAFVVVVLVAAVIGVAACQQAPTTPAQSPVERGKYLVSFAGCNDCHTPWAMGPNGPEPDMKRMLSGHPADVNVPPPPALTGPWMAAASATFTAWAGPWGVSYTANLTPDEETGIGAWDENMFVQAIRTGKHLGGGRDILPPMPWQQYRNMTDEDLKAVFAYLKSVPAIKNQVPEPVIAEPPAAPPASH